MSESKKYLTNKEIIPELEKYKKTGVASEKFGEQLLLLARNLSHKSNFIGYTQDWKEDMISLSVFMCLKYSKNFDTEKSGNAFSYLTKIIYNSFQSYLNTQKKHSNIKKECYNRKDFVPENPYISIDYQSLKRWDELVDKNKKEINVKCVKCGLIQKQEYFINEDGKEAKMHSTNYSCIQCKGTTTKI